MEKLPEKTTLCDLEVLLTKDGKITCKGKFIGWYDSFREMLTEKPWGKKNARKYNMPYM
jgi:hypothetical protein